jgi:hypothetical protein
MKYVSIVFTFLLSTNLFAQVSIGGSHEIPKEKLPKEDHITLPPILDTQTYKGKEHTGLSETNLTESEKLQRQRLVELIKTINYLKEVDYNCSLSSNKPALFKGASTVTEVYSRWSTYSSLFQLAQGSIGLELNPLKDCQCSSPSDSLSCIKKDAKLELMLKENILNSYALEDDLKVIYEDLVKHKLTKDGDSDISFSLKKLISDFYK